MPRIGDRTMLRFRNIAATKPNKIMVKKRILSCVINRVRCVSEESFSIALSLLSVESGFLVDSFLLFCYVIIFLNAL